MTTTVNLFRADVHGGPFLPLSREDTGTRVGASWCESYRSAESFRAQVLAKQQGGWQPSGRGSGYPSIWQTEVAIEDSCFLDARVEVSAIWKALSGASSAYKHLRDAVHDNKEVLIAQGWCWVAFRDSDQHGAEYVYLDGPPLLASQAPYGG